MSVLRNVPLWLYEDKGFIGPMVESKALGTKGLVCATEH